MAVFKSCDRAQEKSRDNDGGDGGGGGGGGGDGGGGGGGGVRAGPRRGCSCGRHHGECAAWLFQGDFVARAAWLLEL